jgi:hypothetical protein
MYNSFQESIYYNQNGNVTNLNKSTDNKLEVRIGGIDLWSWRLRSRFLGNQVRMQEEEQSLLPSCREWEWSETCKEFLLNIYLDNDDDMHMRLEKEP